MKNESGLTCGFAIRKARNEKGLTVNDLAFKISKTKEQEEVRNYERKIDTWEKDRDNPSLDEIYVLAEVLGLNSTELKNLRDNPQRSFTKNFTDTRNFKAAKSRLENTLSDLIIIWGKLVLLFAVILFIIYIVRLFNRSVNDISNVEENDYSDNAIVEYMDEKNIDYN